MQSKESVGLRHDLACMQGGMAPAPAPMMDGPPPLPKASDALALTNSTLNQLQVTRLLALLMHCAAFHIGPFVDTWLI